jgi:hypothetical protein
MGLLLATMMMYFHLENILGVKESTKDIGKALTKEDVEAAKYPEILILLAQFRTHYPPSAALALEPVFESINFEELVSYMESTRTRSLV